MLSTHLSATGTKQLPTDLSGRSLRVLVVDDSASLLEAVCEVIELEQLAQIVGRARDGVEAVQLASTLRPDLLLMDVSMPNMTGLEATELLKRSLPNTRIILMSGEETPEMFQKVHAAGADGFLFKTGFPEDLVRLLDQLFPSNIFST